MIAGFLRATSHNLKYVGIDALARVTRINPKCVMRWFCCHAMSSTVPSMMPCMRMIMAARARATFVQVSVRSNQSTGMVGMVAKSSNATRYRMDSAACLCGAMLS